jgi:hypothetical protein
MSTNIENCRIRKYPIAYLKGEAGKRELYIHLCEDRQYDSSAIWEAVKQGFDRYGLSPDMFGLKEDQIFKSISDFLKGLRSAIETTLRSVYGVRGIIDISLPRVNEHEHSIFTGEFAGDFLITRYNDISVILRVEPKIGWRAYSKMLSETKESISEIISETGVLEPLIGNLYYPLLSTPLSYSILLLRLTELILSSTPPKKTVKIEILSEDVVGKPVISKTLKYAMQGSTYGVFERTRVEPHDAPLMLLAKFHYELSQGLSDMERVLYESMPTENRDSLFMLIAEKIEVLRKLHIEYLTTPPLNQAYNALIRKQLTDAELIQETRRASRVNPYYSLLVDLYEMYISKTGLIHEYSARGLIIPCASSKIYELWILTRIINCLRENRKRLIKSKNSDDLFAVFQVNGFEVAFNEPQTGPIIQDLIKSNLLPKSAHLRPDFIIKRGEVSIVFDAKYKDKLATRDIVTLLAYIAEFASPIEYEGEMVLLGGLYKLQPDHGISRRPLIEIPFRKTLPFKTIIRVCSIEPTLNEEIVQNLMKQALKPLTE